jgi:di/tricarboxylate transporter
MKKSGIIYFTISLLIFLGIVFYFKKESDERFLITLRENCRLAGEKYDKEFSSEITKSGNNPITAEYVYDSNLKTCVISSGWFNANAGSYLFIRDLSTNKILADYMNIQPGQTTPEYTNYMKIKKEIFGGALED